MPAHRSEDPSKLCQPTAWVSGSDRKLDRISLPGVSKASQKRRSPGHGLTLRFAARRSGICGRSSTYQLINSSIHQASIAKRQEVRRMWATRRVTRNGDLSCQVLACLSLVLTQVLAKNSSRSRLFVAFQSGWMGWKRRGKLPNSSNAAYASLQLYREAVRRAKSKE